MQTNALLSLALALFGNQVLALNVAPDSSDVPSADQEHGFCVFGSEGGLVKVPIGQNYNNAVKCGYKWCAENVDETGEHTTPNFRHRAVAACELVDPSSQDPSTYEFLTNYDVATNSKYNLGFPVPNYGDKIWGSTTCNICFEGDSLFSSCASQKAARGRVVSAEDACGADASRHSPIIG